MIDNVSDFRSARMRCVTQREMERLRIAVRRHLFRSNEAMQPTAAVCTALRLP